MIKQARRDQARQAKQYTRLNPPPKFLSEEERNARRKLQQVESQRRRRAARSAEDHEQEKKARREQARALRDQVLEQGLAKKIRHCNPLKGGCGSSICPGRKAVIHCPFYDPTKVIKPPPICDLPYATPLCHPPFSLEISGCFLFVHLVWRRGAHLLSGAG